MVYRRIAILECSLKILQLNLGDRAVKIGFGQIRLETNNLIEILNRQHVILIIQGIPADRRNAVGIQLRKGTK